MDDNTASLWDGIWENPPSEEEDRLALLLEEKSVRWRRIEERVRRAFGTFEGQRVVEIGSGAGTNAALMALRGASVTLLDYSEGALARARQFFERNGVSAKSRRADALALPPDLVGAFDISMSFGLTEHFQGGDRTRITRAHFDVLREGGLTFISVPNRWNPPYRLYKFLAQRTGRWRVGEEIPYTRGELEAICGELGVREYEFFGDSFVASFDLINPITKLRRKRVGKHPGAQGVRFQRGSILDARFSYALVLFARK